MTKVIIGVDPHKPSATIEVVDGHEKSRCPTDCRPQESHTPRRRVGRRVESLPPDTWTESGQTPILREVSQ